MLTLANITGAIDSASRQLTQKYPAQAAHIASLGSAMRRVIAETIFSERTSIHSPSELFDICVAIDTHAELQPHPAIASDIAFFRTAAARTLLKIHYTRERTTSPDTLRTLHREEIVALLLADILPDLQKTFTSGRFGSDAIQERITEESFDLLREYVYDFANDREDWHRIEHLLPASLRNRFDASENGIDIPDEITTKEEALALLQAVVDHKGIPMHVLLDPAHFVTHCKKIPAFRAVIQFFMDRSLVLSPEFPSPSIEQ